MTLFRTQCNELRGVAIIFIVLHNFLHQQRFGFTTQNESSFSIERTHDFLMGFGDGFWHSIYEVFSFLGWLGVPVFVFLSGYGLVKKYEQGSAPLQIFPYIKHSWLKLFLLMFPGILFFALFHQFSGIGGPNVQMKYVVYLSLFGNLVGVDSMTPSIYWYFGLTFELYLAYFILNKYPSKTLLIICCFVPLIIQIILLYLGQDSLVHYNLRNLLGWLPVFSTGVYAARYANTCSKNKVDRVLPFIILLFVSSSLIILCNLNAVSWVFIHFPAILFFYCLIRIFEKKQRIRSVFAFIGSYSSLIFASHPIARLITNECRIESWGIGLELVLYLLLTTVLVFLYKLVYKPKYS